MTPLFLRINSGFKRVFLSFFVTDKQKIEDKNPPKG